MSDHSQCISVERIQRLAEKIRNEMYSEPKVTDDTEQVITLKGGMTKLKYSFIQNQREYAERVLLSLLSDETSDLPNLPGSAGLP